MVKITNLKVNSKAVWAYKVQTCKGLEHRKAIISCNVERLKKISSVLKEHTQKGRTGFAELAEHCFRQFQLDDCIVLLKLFSEHVDKSDLFIVHDAKYKASMFEKGLIDYFGFSRTKRLLGDTIEKKDWKNDIVLVEWPLDTFEKEILDFVGIQ